MSETRDPSRLREHPRSALVPAMAAEEYRAFLANVRERGVLTPLEVTRAGVVLDGRHRLRAALDLGLRRIPVRVVAPEDEVAHLLEAALYRRQLTQSQKAALVLELEAYRHAQVAALARRQAGKKVVATLPQGPERTRELLARRAGVSPRLVQEAAFVKEASPQLFAAIKAGELPAHRAAKRVRREQRRAALPPGRPLPEGPFSVVYADPPWRSSSPGSEWSPEQHYETMPLEEIKALAVPAADDSVLFLWSVNGQLEEAMEVLRAWGFTYKSNIAWVKPSIGLGHWVRNRHELLLIGVRGKVALPHEADRPDSVLEARRGRHSEKPVAAYELIECMFPEASRLELFARRARPGWTAWGNEVAA